MSLSATCALLLLAMVLTGAARDASGMLRRLQLSPSDPPSAYFQPQLKLQVDLQQLSFAPQVQTQPSRRMLQGVNPVQQARSSSSSSSAVDQQVSKATVQVAAFGLKQWQAQPQQQVDYRIVGGWNAPPSRFKVSELLCVHASR